MKPSARYCVNTFECIEKYGYVWVRLEKGGDKEPLLTLSDDSSLTTLRSIYTMASATRIRDWLMSDCESACKAESLSLEISLSQIHQRHSFCVEALAFNNQDNESITIVIYLHPLTDEETVIHSLVNVDIPHDIRPEELRRYNRLFSTVRNVVETGNVR